MKVVCGASGHQGDRAAAATSAEGSFGFMESDVSSEKPQAVLVRQVADGMREAKAAGKKVLWVGGPGVVHTGAAPAMVALVNAGYVDVLFAGNALATHDIESVALRHLARRRPGPGPRRRARPRAPHPGDQHDPQGRARSRAAVEQGVLTGGIMHALVTHGKDVRAGRLGPRRRPAARRLHRRDRGPARDARRAARTSASA